MPAIKCCIDNCESDGKSKHRFPMPEKNRELFNKWIEHCGSRKLATMDPVMVYNSQRVCSEHFLPSDWGRNQKLLPTAYPSLHLPYQPIPHLPEEGNESAAKSMPRKVCQSETVGLPLMEQPSTSTAGTKADFTNEQTLVPDEAVEIYEHESQSFPTTAAVEDKPEKTTRESLLSEVNVRKVEDLTPKAKLLYKKARYFKEKARSSTRSKLSFKRRLEYATKFTSTVAFDKVVSSMDHIKARFFQCQMENADRKSKGKRYTVEDKVLALALYKHSGSGYRLMSKIFDLPSRKTVVKLLNRIPLKPGLSEELFSVMKAEVKNLKNPLDRECILMFDEMSTQPGFSRSSDGRSIDGFEDLGFRQTNLIANHAQVFILRGLRRKWKQPVYYGFVNGAVKYTDIMFSIRTIISKCQEIGLKVIATVCDQGANNQAAIKQLVQDTKIEHARKNEDFNDFIFEVNGEKVIPIYDVPHLFKGLRNNMLNYDFSFFNGDTRNIVKWSEIYTAYKMDPYFGSLRMMPKLTDGHVNPDRIRKMKVSCATQVFSHSVAVAINVLAKSGLEVEVGGEKLKLEERATETAAFLQFLDTLFDSLNTSTFKEKTPGKKYTAAIKKGSPHFKLWDDAVQMLKNSYFLRMGKKFVPPSVHNLIITLKNVKLIFDKMNEVKPTALMTRRLNQDPVENFFAKMRQRGGRNTNPTSGQFIPFYKSLLVKNLSSPVSFGANCQEDDSEIFLSLQRLVTQGLPEEDETESFGNFTNIPKLVKFPMGDIEKQVLKYVSGYVVKKIGNAKCDCKKSFLLHESAEDHEHEAFTKSREYDNLPRLHYVNKSFYSKMQNALNILKFIFNNNFHKKDVLRYAEDVLLKEINLTDCFHNEEISKKVFQYFIRVNAFNYIKQLNNLIKGKDLRAISPDAPKMFHSARTLYLKGIKRKK